MHLRRSIDVHHRAPTRLIRTSIVHPTSMSTLPAEILSQICRELTMPERFGRSHDTATLAQLSQCSRRLNQLCVPLLYQSVMVGNSQTAALLRRTIREKPEVARLVKRLDLVTAHDIERDNPFDLGHADDSVALLLSRLPELQSLNVYVDRDMTPVLQMFDRAMRRSVPGDLDESFKYDEDDDDEGQDTADDVLAWNPLTKLSNLNIDTTFISHDFDLHSIVLLPSLRDLAIVQCLPSTLDLEMDGLKLERLMLTECRLYLEQVTHLLRACDMLREVRYHWDERWYEVDEEDDELGGERQNMGPQTTASLLRSAASRGIWTSTDRAPCEQIQHRLQT